MLAAGRIRPYFVLFFLLQTLCSYGQEGGSLRGRVKAGDEGEDCREAAVSLLSRDSSLIQFSRTAKDGRFVIAHLDTGNFLLLITSPGYEAFYRWVILGKKSPFNLGVLILQPKADSLQPVTVISREIRPHFRGDTLEYDVGRLRMNRNASVEELLRRLPGLEIAPDGTITYNGQKVDRLLVDGEDIFSANPTVVTRNFNADLIDKVQLLDKKDLQAQFSGVQDGNSVKTLNLTVKDDRKHGYFGKLEAGTDFGNYYNSNAFVGSLVGKQQFIGLGMAANTGNNWISGGSGGAQAALSISGASVDPLGASAGPGIPKIMAAGTHYANTWNGAADHVTGNYQFGHLSTQPATSLVSIQTLNDTVFHQQQESSSVNTQEQHSANLVYDVAPDSLSTGRLMINGLETSSRNQYTASGSNAFNNRLVNSSQNNIRSNVDDQSLGGTFTWQTRAPRKTGRTLSLFGAFSYGNNTTDGFLYALDRFYFANGNIQNTDTTDQRKKYFFRSQRWRGDLSYTDVAGKYIHWGVAFNFSFTNAQSIQRAFAHVGGKYDALIDSLSSNFKDLFVREQARLFVQEKFQALTLTLGLDLSYDDYRQDDLLQIQNRKYAYSSFLPHLYISYHLSSRANLFFGYRESIELPSFSQLAPVLNNNNPLAIALGNPNLSPSYSHGFEGNYDRVGQTAIYVSWNFHFTSNDISTMASTDSLGRQVSQAINVSGDKGGIINFSLNKKLKSLNVDVGVISNMSYTHSVNYINARISRNDAFSTGAGIRVSRYVADRYNFRLNSEIGWFDSRSSVDPGATICYFTQTDRADIGYFISPGLEINTGLNYSWRQKISVFDNNNTTVMWNGYINKDLFDHRASLRGSINNLLNQNAGISRSSFLNQTTQTATNVIGRYYLISAIWHFDKTGGRK